MGILENNVNPSLHHGPIHRPHVNSTPVNHRFFQMGDSEQNDFFPFFYGKWIGIVSVKNLRKLSEFLNPNIHLKTVIANLTVEIIVHRCIKI